MTDEKAWIIQAQHGDDEAFTRLVETYQTPVFNLCYRMLGEPEAAEDAAQEAFLKAYKNIARYDRERSFPTWLLAIAAHHCIDKLRRRRYLTFSIDEDEERTYELPDRNALDPEAEFIRRQEQDHMHKLLCTLDPTDRAALILRYWYDCSEVEIAQALELTVPAVKSRLHRTRRALAKRYQDEAPEARAERRPYESPAF
ncbi:MAG: sigma-70 family RNA polymerase sigma factor [Chloroflexota bacterium]